MWRGPRQSPHYCWGKSKTCADAGPDVGDKCVKQALMPATMSPMRSRRVQISRWRLANRVTTSHSAHGAKARAKAPSNFVQIVVAHAPISRLVLFLTPKTCHCPHHGQYPTWCPDMFPFLLSVDLRNVHDHGARHVYTHSCIITAFVPHAPAAACSCGPKNAGSRRCR